MTSSKAQSPIEISRSASGEKRLTELDIALPPPPEHFGIYVDAVQRGNLLCLTGMFQTRGREAKFIGRVRAELDVHAGSESAQLVALNAIAVARKHLRSLDRVTRSSGSACCWPLQERPCTSEGRRRRFGVVPRGFRQKQEPCRFVYRVASLPLGALIELEVIFEGR